MKSVKIKMEEQRISYRYSLECLVLDINIRYNIVGWKIWENIVNEIHSTADPSIDVVWLLFPNSLK